MRPWRCAATVTRHIKPSLPSLCLFQISTVLLSTIWITWVLSLPLYIIATENQSWRQDPRACFHQHRRLSFWLFFFFFKKKNLFTDATHLLFSSSPLSIAVFLFSDYISEKVRKSQMTAKTYNTKKNEQTAGFSSKKKKKTSTGANLINLTNNQAFTVSISQDTRRLCHGQGQIRQWIWCVAVCEHIHMGIYVYDSVASLSLVRSLS